MNRRVYVQSADTIGTVKWIGFLPGLESERAGIELDSPPTISGHSGEYMGQKIFPCAQKCGIFLKLSKLNFGLSFKDALEEKYMMANDDPPSPLNEKEYPVSKIPSPILVGEKQAREYFSENLFDLEEISLDSRKISFHDIDGPSFLAQFTRLRRLSVCATMIDRVDNIVRIAQSIPSLQFLDLSNNKIFQKSEVDEVVVCRNIIELVLNDSHLVIDNCFTSLLSTHFPNLKKLSLRRNIEIEEKCQFPQSLEFLSLSFPSVLPTNIMSSFSPPCMIKSLEIDGIPLKTEDIVPIPSLTHLTIVVTENVIASLAVNFPQLESLTLTSTGEESNQFYDASMRVRSIILTSFPSLKVLNNSTIRPNHRTEAFKYCVALVGRNDQLALSIIPPDILTSLKQSLVTVSESTHSENRTTRMNRMFLDVLIVGAEKIPVRIPISATFLEFTSIVARKISWPLKLSQLRISVRSPHGDDSDLVPISTTADLGYLDDGWYVYTSVYD